MHIAEARPNEKRRRRHAIILFSTRSNRRAKRHYESRKSFDGFL